MTQPGGGHGNDINLAALWIPVMPETSHMGEEMRKAGAESKRKFEEGFNSGTSPEALGSGFSAKLSSSISQGLSKIELPLGLGKAIDQLAGDVDTKLISKVQGEAAQALSKYRQEYENLTQTLATHTEAQNRLNVARDNGFTKASLMLPLISEESRSHTALNEQVPKTTAAYEEYANKSRAAAEATKGMASGTSLLAGAIGGLAVVAAQGVVSGIEHIAEAGIEGFKKSIELVHEFADQMVELGETYEHLGIQITEFSGATGEQFEELEAHAQSVFASLDVAGKNTGQTMAQFAAILDAEPSAALDRLTQHTEELQGRYSSLKATDLASIFYAFKTPAEEADSALASLLQSARNSGQDLGQLSSALSGDVSYTLQEAGLNLEQAGAFTGKLMEMGTSGRSVIMGLNTAMKDFGKEGLSFSDGMKLAATRLNELGDTAEGQDLSEKLFGTRRWAVAKAAVQEYLDVVDQGPDAFHSSGDAIDEFAEKTRTLQNEWEIVKHKAEEAFLPMGLEAVHLAGTGIDWLAKYIDTHMDGIKKTIKSGGDFIIDFAASTQNLAIALLTFFAPVVDAIDAVFGEALKGMGLFVQAEGEILSHIPGFTDMGNSLIDVGKNAQEFGGKLENIHVGDKMKDVAEWLKDHKIDVDKAKDSWDTYADHVADATEKAAQSVENSGGAIGSGLAMQAGLGGIGAPSMPGVPGGIPGAPGGSTPGQSPLSAITGAGAGGGAEANKALAKQLFTQYFPESEWAAFEQLEMHEAGFDSTARNPSSGAFGMGQFLGHEHDQYASGYSTDPATQLVTMFQYIRNRYGTPGAAWAQYYQHPGGKGWYSKGDLVTGGSGTKDDVPAMLTAGEYVWDKETTAKWGWLISAIHKGAMGFQGGGPVDDVEGTNAQIHFVDEIAKGFGLQLTAGKSGHGTHDVGTGWHDSGAAGDFSGDTEHMLAFAMYMFEHYGSELSEIIFNDPRMTQLIKDGKAVDPQQVYGPWLPGHKNHVHIAVQPTSPMQDLSPGTEALGVGTAQMPAFGGAGSTPGGTTGANFPGLAGQYGGGGAYGGQTADEAASAAKAVQEAHDRAADLDHTIAQNQKRIDDLKAQIAQVGISTKTGELTGKPLPLTPDEQTAADQKRKQLNDQLDEATYQLSKSQRERAEQDTNIADATRKQTESYYKKPSGAKAQVPKAVGAQEFEQLGSSLLGGIGQELGFGDLFAKPPWEWGAVKLLTGAASWALGTANAWADEIGKGHTGMTGFQPIAGWDDQGGATGGGMLGGLTGSLGIQLPKAPGSQSVSSGPNIVTTQPPGPFGAPTGPAPGPVNIDNSIHVSSDVSDTKVLAPVQEQRNAQNSTLHGYTGGLPQ